MTHTISVKDGFTAYPDCEFGPSGHHWSRARCTCRWKGPERVHYNGGNGARVQAKADGFDHHTAKASA